MKTHPITLPRHRPRRCQFDGTLTVRQLHLLSPSTTSGFNNLLFFLHSLA